MKEEKKIEELRWEVPICCREGWANCPHVIQKQKKQEINEGL